MSIVARLSALLTADTAGFESGFARANRTTKAWQAQTTSSIAYAERSFSGFDKHVRSSIGSVIDLKSQLGGIATAFAGALSINKVAQYADQWSDLESRVRNVDGAMSNSGETMERLDKMARRTYTSFSQTAETYLLNAKTMKELGIESQTTLDWVESVNNALVVSGAKGQRAESVMNALSKAMALGKLSGDNLNTVITTGGRVAEALADSMGVSVIKLREMGAKGQITRAHLVGLTSQLGKLREEADAMPATIGDAMVLLDNAFLKFIGQSEQARKGATSVSMAIIAIADNFEVLALTVGAVAAAFAGKLVSQMALYVFTTTAATVRTIAFNYTLATLAFSTRAAAIGMTTLLGATTAMGAAIAALGGPIGVAIIGTIGLIAAETRAAGIAQAEMNKRLEEHRTAAQDYIYANEERRKEIRKSTRDNIENLKSEMEAQRLLFEEYERRSGFGKFMQNLRLPGTEGNGKNAILNRGFALKKGIEEMEGLLARLDEADKGVVNILNGGGDSGKTKKDKYAEIIRGLQEESAALDLQVKMYGQKETAINRAQKALRIEQQLSAAGVVLTQKQRAEIDKYLDSIERQTELQKKQEEQQKRLERQERDREQALNQLGSTFESAFEKAILEGEKLSDVLDGLLNDVLRIMTRIVVTEPLTTAIGDVFKGSGGGGSSIFSGLFDWLRPNASLAVGTANVPRDMVAQIHKGEMVVPAYDAEQIRKGGLNGGGGNVNINIVNNAGVDIRASQQDSANGTDILVTVERAMAESVNRNGSPMNQALKTFNGRSYVRR